MTVTIPPPHQSDQIERSETLPPDPALYFTIQNPVLLDEEQGFLRAFNAEIRSRPADQRGVMVFIHGFNTTLTDAVLGIAQFVEDTGFNGIPLLFSRASGGRVQDYVYDINSVLAARDDLLLGAVLVAKSEATSVDLVAHSTGNLLAVEGMRQAKLEGTLTKLGKLHNVILASPDIDVDLFRRQRSVFPPDERRFYVFISRGDTALRASRVIGGGVPRVGAGDVKALTERGVTVIDLSKITTSGSSHSKFARSPEIVQLIGTRLSIDGPLQDSAQTPGLARSILELPITVAQGFAAGQ